MASPIKFERVELKMTLGRVAKNHPEFNRNLEKIHTIVHILPYGTFEVLICFEGTMKRPRLVESLTFLALIGPAEVEPLPKFRSKAQTTAAISAPPSNDFAEWLDANDGQAKVSSKAAFRDMLRYFCGESIRSVRRGILTTDFTQFLPRRRVVLWSVPLAVAFLSYASYPATSSNFHKLVQWASAHTWIPKNEDVANIQMNVVTQVVNGPVISAISILFGCLASMTVSNMYDRQVSMRRSHATEVQALRQLRIWVQQLSINTNDDAVVHSSDYHYHSHHHHHHLSRNAGTIGLELLRAYTNQLDHESRPTNDLEETMSLSAMWDSRSQHAGDLHLMALLKWCQELYVEACSQQDQPDRQELRQALTKHYSYARDVNSRFKSKPFVSVQLTSQYAWSLPPLEVLQQMHGLITTMLEQRQLRWLALTTVFPVVHWMTLSLLAVSVALSFLIASDSHEVLFKSSLPVRMLWSLTTSSISALAVLCIDLSSPFGGAYQAFSEID